MHKIQNGGTKIPNQKIYIFIYAYISRVVDMSEAMNDEYLNLVELLFKYDELLEQLQTCMSEGYTNLGRANYHNKDSLRGRYGRDYWDELYIGELIVTYSKEDSQYTISKKVPEDDDAHEVTDKDNSNDSKIRNRNKVNENKKEKEKKIVNKNPISMFGGVLSIPSSLRQCQTNFKGCVPLFSELINCQNDIKKLSSILEHI